MNASFYSSLQKPFSGETPSRYVPSKLLRASFVSKGDCSTLRSANLDSAPQNTISASAYSSGGIVTLRCEVCQLQSSARNSSQIVVNLSKVNRLNQQLFLIACSRLAGGKNLRVSGFSTNNEIQRAAVRFSRSTDFLKTIRSERLILPDASQRVIVRPNPTRR